jgi:cephalosporin hydroxylase
VTDVEDDKVTFLEGDALRLEDVLDAATLAEMPKLWLALEDSAHLYETSFVALEVFHISFQPGDYTVIEDGNVDDMGRSSELHGGPNRVIKEFFSDKQQTYELDTAFCDYWGYNLTWNTNGYWRRIS